MQDIFTVTGIGRLTRDPELRTLPGGTSVLSMRVAWNQSKRLPNGSWEDVPGFIDVSYFGRPAEAIQQYLSTGKQVAITGRLQYREWKDSDGNRRNATDVVAERVQLLGSGDRDGQPSQRREQSLPEPQEPETPNVPF